ncbi:pre-mRNA-splicing factor 38B isoform X1 [Coregonus clupeaformis]|uniref:pre-mRNA-splicing factor 38B isoform X1 n=2 Tax=Coregonus clupeaformis TaxID=59861 RepID=UPI001BE0B3BF|nr:pre-mRNA-splicing factor 38B isoform X1 [Coregonus clupeaformis]
MANNNVAGNQQQPQAVSKIGPNAGKHGNNLPLWGNEKTMNLNPMVLTNVLSSPYFKVQLYELKTYHEVVDEIYFKVTHVEPWEKGSRKTAGQTGMCGGVRGVGTGGIVSTAFCLLYKLFTLKMTRKQVMGLITHNDSPYIRALGFMYIRYTQPPADLVDWYDGFMDDEEELDVKAGGGCVMTIGEMVRSFLTKLEWFSTLFPRIPVPVQKMIDTQMKARPRKVPEKVEEPEKPPTEEGRATEGRRRSRSPRRTPSPRRSPKRSRSRSHHRERERHGPSFDRELERERDRQRKERDTKDGDRKGGDRERGGERERRRSRSADRTQERRERRRSCSVSRDRKGERKDREKDGQGGGENDRRKDRDYHKDGGSERERSKDKRSKGETEDRRKKEERDERRGHKKAKRSSRSASREKRHKDKSKKREVQEESGGRAEVREEKEKSRKRERSQEREEVQRSHKHSRSKELGHRPREPSNGKDHRKHVERRTSQSTERTSADPP